jgi:hypothetical protein
MAPVDEGYLSLEGSSVDVCRGGGGCSEVREWEGRLLCSLGTILCGSLLSSGGVCVREGKRERVCVSVCM